MSKEIERSILVNFNFINSIYKLFDNIEYINFIMNIDNMNEKRQLYFDIDSLFENNDDISDFFKDKSFKVFLEKNSEKLTRIKNFDFNKENEAKINLENKELFENINKDFIKHQNENNDIIENKFIFEYTNYLMYSLYKNYYNFLYNKSNGLLKSKLMVLEEFFKSMINIKYENEMSIYNYRFMLKRSVILFMKREYLILDLILDYFEFMVINILDDIKNDKTMTLDDSKIYKEMSNFLDNENIDLTEISSKSDDSINKYNRNIIEKIGTEKISRYNVFNVFYANKIIKKIETKFYENYDIYNHIKNLKYYVSLVEKKENNTKFLNKLKKEYSISINFNYMGKQLNLNLNGLFINFNFYNNIHRYIVDYYIDNNVIDVDVYGNFLEIETINENIKEMANRIYYENIFVFKEKEDDEDLFVVKVQNKNRVNIKDFRQLKNINDFVDILNNYKKFNRDKNEILKNEYLENDIFDLRNSRVYVPEIFDSVDINKVDKKYKIKEKVISDLFNMLENEDNKNLKHYYIDGKTNKYKDEFFKALLFDENFNELVEILTNGIYYNYSKISGDNVSLKQYDLKTLSNDDREFILGYILTNTYRLLGLKI